MKEKETEIQKGRVKTRFPGVYSRMSTKRRYAGRPDVAFDIVYSLGRSKKWEMVGWKSEGVNAQYASKLRSERVLEIRQKGSIASLRSLTLDDAFETYRANHLVTTKSEARIVSMYKASVQKTFGGRKLHQITTFDLQRFATSLTGKRAPATIRHYLSIIRSVYNKMIVWGLYAGKVPTYGVVVPYIDNERDRFLSREEAKVLLDELRSRSEDTYRVALLSLNTGMRAGEIFKLKGEDVDLEDWTIRIRDPKNRKSRIAYMSDAVKAMLEKLELRRGRYVFPARGGGKRVWVPATFDRAVEHLGLNRGVKDARDRIVFHSLRHTFAAWLASEGVPLYTISKLLGHSTIKMTERYAKLMPKAKKEAIDLLNNVVSLE